MEALLKSFTGRTKHSKNCTTREDNFETTNSSTKNSTDKQMVEPTPLSHFHWLTYPGFILQHCRETASSLVTVTHCSDKKQNPFGGLSTTEHKAPSLTASVLCFFWKLTYHSLLPPSSGPILAKNLCCMINEFGQLAFFLALQWTPTRADRGKGEVCNGLIWLHSILTVHRIGN